MFMELAGLLSGKIGEDIHLAHSCNILGLLENVASFRGRCHKRKGNGLQNSKSIRSFRKPDEYDKIKIYFSRIRCSVLMYGLQIVFVDDDKIEETLLRDISKEELPTTYGGLKVLVPLGAAQPPNWPPPRPATVKS